MYIIQTKQQITIWIKKNELLSPANAKCHTVQKTKRNAYKSVAPKGNQTKLKI